MSRVLTWWGDPAVLRIEKDSDGCVTRLILSGRIQSEHIACLRSAMSDGCARDVLDLTEVTLVDLGGVRFPIRCEEEGIELLQCPSYVREWMPSPIPEPCSSIGQERSRENTALTAESRCASDSNSSKRAKVTEF
jgi:hypothetical protein